MRVVVLFIMLFLALEGVSYGQKKPPPPPPPPSPKGDTGSPRTMPGNAGSSNGSETGFQVVKVPVIGNYSLGMLEKDFTTPVPGSGPAIKTSDFTYPVQLQPEFYRNRLFRLELSGSGIFESNLDDITVKYQLKNGTPDSSSVTDTTESYTDPKDSTKTSLRTVRKVRAEWILKYYTLIFTATIYRYDDTHWKGNFVVDYEGNDLYKELLRQVYRKENEN
ncbi:MAG: hypothetical protein ABIR30_14215 [Chitinophagaceae bacterium]